MSESKQQAQPIPFKAETKQILDILIHSLYTEKEIFLRELISNASDALTRLDFEQLTNHDILDPEAELGIWISFDETEKTLTITDTGIGMDADELTQNLGTIAQSGARSFLAAAKETEKIEGQTLSDIIGQFGVGFYSVFMVAEWVRVESRSFRQEAIPASWICEGEDSFIIGESDKKERGTSIVIKLNDDSAEFLQEYRLREIIRKHSDFISFPIYLGENTEQTNTRTALWRQTPREIEQNDYDEYYKQLTLDFNPPLTYTHLSADAPVQVYSILYTPSKFDRGMFSLRKEDGLKLYARKILILDYCKDLLPEYLQFIHGVVDSEDLPLNVSRESVQSNRVMAQLKKLITSRALDMINKLANDEPEKYETFWKEFGRFIKQGLATEQNETEDLKKLLRFRTTKFMGELSSLDGYVSRMAENQTDIYFIMGDDDRSVLNSPHLDAVSKHDYEVLLMTDPMDAFMLVRLDDYQDHKFRNVAKSDLELPDLEVDKPDTEVDNTIPVEEWTKVIDKFKSQLGDLVQDVRMTDRLANSPARLVDPEGAINQEMQRVYRYLQEEFEAPKKILELNPKHPIIIKLHQLEDNDGRFDIIVDQIFDNVLLIEGLHKDPANMIGRIHKIIETALD